MASGCSRSVKTRPATKLLRRCSRNLRIPSRMSTRRRTSIRNWRFVVRPATRRVSVRIDWRRFISSFNTEVGFKADGGKTLWQKWGVDQSNKITLSKSAADSQSLVDYLSGGSSSTDRGLALLRTTGHRRVRSRGPPGGTGGIASGMPVDGRINSTYRPYAGCRSATIF